MFSCQTGGEGGGARPHLSFATLVKSMTKMNKNRTKTVLESTLADTKEEDEDTFDPQHDDHQDGRCHDKHHKHNECG